MKYKLFKTPLIMIFLLSIKAGIAATPENKDAFLINDTDFRLKLEVRFSSDKNDHKRELKSTEITLPSRAYYRFFHNENIKKFTLTKINNGLFPHDEYKLLHQEPPSALTIHEILTSDTPVKANGKHLKSFEFKMGDAIHLKIGRVVIPNYYLDRGKEVCSGVCEHFGFAIYDGKLPSADIFRLRSDKYNDIDIYYKEDE